MLRRDLELAWKIPFQEPTFLDARNKVEIKEIQLRALKENVKIGKNFSETKVSSGDD